MSTSILCAPRNNHLRLLRAQVERVTRGGQFSILYVLKLKVNAFIFSSKLFECVCICLGGRGEGGGGGCSVWTLWFVLIYNLCIIVYVFVCLFRARRFDGNAEAYMKKRV